jgi:hypothetical protein
MPYIPKRERPRYNPLINEIVKQLVEKLPGDNGKNFSEGDLNYVISSIIWKLFDKRPSYTLGNKLVGALDCIRLEFYARKVRPYEDQKIKENGDI